MMSPFKTKLRVSIALFAMLASPLARAVPIAVVDSGTDLNHPDLASHQWTNIYDWEDGVDNDDNGYIDDVHGWNFGESNNQLYNKKLVGTWSPDTYKFFDVQTRVLTGSATADDLAWLKGKEADPAFLENLENFGNWVHGTHVAGISSRNAPGAQIMPLKFIASAGSSFLRDRLLSPLHAEETDKDDSVKIKLIRLALDALSSVQGTALAPIGQYLNREGARVANCSFGSSAAQVKQLIAPIIGKVLGHTLTDEESATWASYFLNGAVESMKKQFIAASPNTMFVIAAGNDGTNNDELPAAPANVRAPNVITVAATRGVGSLASFSNYGPAHVDIAAPGVGILSSIPGNAHLMLSGTSQATPFVTNIVGQMLDAGPDLSMDQVKALLFGTVDRKDFLKDKVASGGVANPARALRATQLFLTERTLDQAIAQARLEIPDREEDLSASNPVVSEHLYVTPLTRLMN